MAGLGQAWNGEARAAVLILDEVKEAKQAAQKLRKDSDKKSFVAFLFRLGQAIKDSPAFAEEFLAEGGLDVVSCCLGSVSGSQQSELLKIIRMLLLYENAIDQFTEENIMVERIYNMLKGGSNRAKQVLEILIVTVGSTEHGSELVRDAAKKVVKGDQPFAAIVPLLQDYDLNVVANVLAFLNILITKSSPAAADEVKALLKKCGLLTALQPLNEIEDSAIKDQLTVFQKLTGHIIPLGWYAASQYQLRAEELRKRQQQALDTLSLLQSAQAKVSLIQGEMKHSQDSLCELRAAMTDVKAPIAPEHWDDKMEKYSCKVFKDFSTTQEFKGKMMEAVKEAMGASVPTWSQLKRNQTSEKNIWDYSDSERSEDSEPRDRIEIDSESRSGTVTSGSASSGTITPPSVGSSSESGGDDIDDDVGQGVITGEDVALSHEQGALPQSVDGAVGHAASVPGSDVAAVPGQAAPGQAAPGQAAAPPVVPAPGQAAPGAPAAPPAPAAPGAPPAAPPGKGKSRPPPPPGKKQPGGPRGKGPKEMKLKYWKGLVPKSKMKVMHWEKFALYEGQHSMWHNVHPELGGTLNCGFDEEEFETMYRQKVADRNAPSAAKVVQKVTLIDDKKFQNISIMMHKMPPIPEIQRAVQQLDNTILDRDQLEALISQVPTEEDESNFKAKMDEKPEDEYEPPEQFFAMVITSVSFTMRCKAWMLTFEWDEIVSTAMRPIAKLRAACQSIMDSEHLPFVMGLILGFGNFMNHGSAKGNAPGFAVVTLSKLEMTKDITGKMNLLQYVVHQVKEKNINALKLTEELKPCLEGAQGIKNSDLEDGLNKVTNAIRLFKKNVVQVKNKLSAAGVSEEQDPFVRRMTEFCERAEKDQKKVETEFNEAKDLFISVLDYWAAKRLPNKTPDPDEFFCHLCPFLEKFSNEASAILKEIRRLEKIGKVLQAKDGSKGEDALEAVANEIKVGLVQS